MTRLANQHEYSHDYLIVQGVRGYIKHCTVQLARMGQVRMASYQDTSQWPILRLAFYLHWSSAILLGLLLRLEDQEVVEVEEVVEEVEEGHDQDLGQALEVVEAQVGQNQDLVALGLGRELECLI